MGATSKRTLQEFFKDKPISKSLVAISMGHSSAHWYISSFLIILPFVQTSLGLTYTEVSIIISIRYLVGAIVNIPSGIFIDLIDKRKIFMCLSLFFMGVPFLYMGIAGTYMSALISIAIIEIFIVAWHPAAIAELRERFEENKGWAIGIHSLAANFGDFLAPIIIGLLLMVLSWRFVVILNIIPGFLVGVAIYYLLEDIQKRKKETGKKESGPGLKDYLQGIGKAMKSPGFISLLIVSAVARSLTQSVLRSYLPLYFNNHLLLSSALIGVYMAIIEVSGSIASPIAGYLSDNRGRKMMVIVGLTVTAFCVVGITVFTNPIIFIAFLVVLGFFMYSLRPIIYAWSMEIVPDAYGGITVGVILGTQHIMAAVTPLFGGYIGDTWGLHITLYFIAAIILLCNLVVVYGIKDSPKGVSS